MRIMILSKMWDASAGIGALRPMKLAKYLLRAGHSVDAVCAGEIGSLENPCSDLVYLRSLEGYRELPCLYCTGIFELEDRIVRRNRKTYTVRRDGAEATPAAAPKKKPNFLKRIAVAILVSDLFQSMKKRNMIGNACKSLCREGVCPDVILSSYEPIEVHLLAERLKRYFPDAVWIADFRDPMPNKRYQNERVFRKYEMEQKRLCAKADAVTIVSETWRREFEAEGIERTHTIYSGFDPDDFDAMRGRTPPAERFVFTYAGSLYSELDTLQPFFNALKTLIGNGSIHADRIRIVYAGKHGDEFERQIKAAEVGVAYENYGFIPREESLQLLAQSDALLHALYCFPDKTGMITGRLGEYLLANKPILSIINGPVEASEYKRIIAESNSGLVYEIKNQGTDDAPLCEYIARLYREKFRDGSVCFKQNREYVARFDYRCVAERLIQIAQQAKDAR